MSWSLSDSLQVQPKWWMTTYAHMFSDNVKLWETSNKWGNKIKIWMVPTNWKNSLKRTKFPEDKCQRLSSDRSNPLYKHWMTKMDRKKFFRRFWCTALTYCCKQAVTPCHKNQPSRYCSTERHRARSAHQLMLRCCPAPPSLQPKH